MKIDTNIQVCQSRYNVQIDTSKWTALECEKLQEFGEPTIDIGGTFTGSLGRPGQTNTVVTITGGGGSGATATPVIVAGVITGFVVTAPGTGYTSTPAVGFTGDGTGATATAVLSGTTLLSITVVTGGTGYHVYPVPISLVFPSALRRIRSDFPIKRVFDLEDTPNADVQAQFYATAIVALLTTAKNTLIASTTPFEGESAVTV